jgi:hypothetical protein
MSYLVELERMARALSQLSINGLDDMQAVEIDIALSARRAVINTLETVLVDLTGINVLHDRRHFFVIATTHPVAGLLHSLRDHPVPPPEVGPMSAFVIEPQSPAGKAWRDAARHAALARHEWTAGPVARIDHVQAWTGVAELAAASAFLADADVNLLGFVQAHIGPGSELARELGWARASGLGIIAREVLRLAEAGPLHETGPDRSAPQPQDATILAARNLEEVAPAIHQVGVLVRDAAHIGPEALRQLINDHARACLAIAGKLQNGSETSAVADQLREHVARLATAIDRPWPAASTKVSDFQPGLQMRVVLNAVHQPTPPDGTARIHTSSVLASVAKTSRELAAAAERHVITGSWTTVEGLLRSPERKPRAKRREKVPRHAAVPAASAVDFPRPILRLFAAADHALTLLALPSDTATTSPTPVVAPQISASFPTPAADPAAPRPPPKQAATPVDACSPWRNLAHHSPRARPPAPWMAVQSRPKGIRRARR